MYHTNYPEEIHKLSFHLCRVIFTAALHFRTLFLCPCFLQLHGFYWQGWRKHTKPVLSGGLRWLTDPTTHSAGNNFLALQCGLKTMEKNPASSYTGEFPLELSKQLFQNSCTAGRFTIETLFKSLGKTLHSVITCRNSKLRLWDSSMGHVLTELPQTFSTYIANTYFDNWLFLNKSWCRRRINREISIIHKTNGSGNNSTQKAW